MTIGIAYVFYKLLDEDRSDFIEIIMLCFEGIAISVMMEHSSMNALITVRDDVYDIHEMTSVGEARPW